MSSRAGVLLVVAGCRIGFDPIAVDIDAPSVTCPSSYTVMLGSSSSSYRVSSEDKLLTAHHAACTSDAPSGTHLVFIDDVMEQADLYAVLRTVPRVNGDRFYVGVVQPPGEADLASAWVSFAGDPVAPDLWRRDEPNDLDLIEDGGEQLAVVDVSFAESGQLVDVSGNASYGAICECDGLLVDPAVVADLP
ncbi:MAG: C-type lectin domain-containing protein [Deltaproteobacteria bacterium]|nr:C-type lectin domain-containing protein [Deltaproteobacteria bacterium]